MEAKQVATKRTSLMPGHDSDDTQLVSKIFYRRRDEQRLENNVELTKLFPRTTQKWWTQDVRPFINKVRA